MPSTLRCIRTDQFRGPKIALQKQAQKPIGYHKHPERAAWGLILAAQLALCTLMAGAWWSVNWYLTNARDHFSTTVTSINGTVLAKSIRADSPVPVLPNSQLDVDEFTIISTDETSQAALTFYDDSAITLYSNTTLIIHHSNQARYKWGGQSDLIEIEIVKGRIRAGPSNTASKRVFRLKTLHGQIILSQGSYSVEANNNQTQVTARLGSAEVSAQGQTTYLQAGQLTTIAQGQPPVEAMAAEQNMLVNGNFSEALATSWQQNIFVPDNATGIVTASLQIETIGGRPVIQFISQGEDNIHTEAVIEQVINKDVQDFQSLRLNADVRLNYQSLSGGGFVGSEFPLRIHLSYKDADGNDRDWYHGFYYDPPPENYLLYNQADNASENISQNIWYPYESENLLALLGDSKPVYVKSIRVYASGWIYDAMVTDVKLLAQD